MSLHQLTAGSGPDYLTRQVAVSDSTEKRYKTLATHYSEKAEAPGHWVGSDSTMLEALSAADVMTAKQMKALSA